MASNNSAIGGLRIGHGFDTHKLVKDRDLLLGGIKLESEFGLLGHSDADVLIHSFIDAVCGALKLGDIGRWFPDDDPQYKDSDSKYLFSKVWEEVNSLGYSLVNADCVVLAEKPKIKPYVGEIESSLASLFDCDLDQISVKATTGEGLGYIGRGEGISVSSVVLLCKKP